MPPLIEQTDEAAAEAAKNCLSVAILHSREILKALDAEFPQVSVHEARETAEANLARIITDAYVKQTDHLDDVKRGWGEAVAIHIRVVTDFQARLTAERDVREKLVEALGLHMVYGASPCYAHDLAECALAAAEKLEGCR